MTDSLQNYSNLGVALALGLLIGIQRGWVSRGRKSGERVAGVRTFSLVGLLGGLAALLAQQYGPMLIGVFLLSLTAVLIAAYWRSMEISRDVSITTLVGTLLTFCFGLLAGAGLWTLAASAAIVTALILDYKDEIHGLLDKLKENELDAGLKLLLISVVMLSILPNETLDPWDTLNPYEIWWMVVLIASISFIGYFSVRIGGTHKGLMFTSLFAGLSSSTALTLNYARLCRENPQISRLLSSGILVACGTMFPRIWIVTLLLNRELAQALLMPILAMTLLTYLPAFWHWRASREYIEQSVTLKQNPLELGTAITFGAFLLLIILAANWLHAWLGDHGILILAALSGISDVDAITLTLAREAGSLISAETAATAIIIAAAVNSLVKGTMAYSVGGRPMLGSVLFTMIGVVFGGLLVVTLT